MHQLLAKHVLHTVEYYKQGRYFPWATWSQTWRS